MLFKTAIALLIVWLLGMFGVYRVATSRSLSARRTDAPVAGRAQGAGSCPAAPGIPEQRLMAHTRSKLASFVFDNSLLLLAGTIAAVTWANLDVASYDRVAHSLRFWVNEVGMVFFFALAAKEVFEATLPGGALASPRHALSPLSAAVGGMVAPAVIYLALSSTVGPAELSRGWAIPCATDIAFSAMIARVIFRPGHPAIPFLLLLAIADDALGLLILAVFYPSGPLSAHRTRDADDGGLVGGALAAAPPRPQLLALRRRSGCAVVGRAPLWRLSSGPGACANRSLHATQRAGPWAVRSARSGPNRHAQSVRALVGGARAVRPAAVWLRDCRRPVRTDWAGHLLRAGRTAVRQADRHPAVRGCGCGWPERASRKDCVSPTWWSLASPPRSASRFPCSSPRPRSQRERHWPKRRWGRSSASVPRPWRSWRRDC